MAQIKVTKTTHKISIKADTLPEVWFFVDEEFINVPSPVIKSARHARLWADVIRTAAEEWDNLRVRNDIQPRNRQM